MVAIIIGIKATLIAKEELVINSHLIELNIAISIPGVGLILEEAHCSQEVGQDFNSSFLVLEQHSLVVTPHSLEEEKVKEVVKKEQMRTRLGLSNRLLGEINELTS